MTLREQIEALYPLPPMPAKPPLTPPTARHREASDWSAEDWLGYYGHAVLDIIDQHRCIPDRDTVLLFASAIAAQMPEEWVESESSMAMTVTVRCRDVAAIIAALEKP